MLQIPKTSSYIQLLCSRPVLTRMSLICWQLGVSSRHGYHSVFSAGICTYHDVWGFLEILIEKMSDGTTHISSVIQRSNPLQTILISGGYLVDICRVTAPWLLGSENAWVFLPWAGFGPRWISRQPLGGTWRKPIGEVSCCDSWQSELMDRKVVEALSLSLSLKLKLSLPPSLCVSLSFPLSIYLSTYLSLV